MRWLSSITIALVIVVGVALAWVIGVCAGVAAFVKDLVQT